MRRTQRWVSFLGFIGFLVTALIVLLAVLSIVGFEAERVGTVPTAALFVYPVLAVLSYVPSYYLYKYSRRIHRFVAQGHQVQLESAQRELREETGLTARRWEQILFVHISNSVTDEEGYVFTAEDLEQGAPEFESSEKLEVRRLPVREAMREAMQGRITDGLSVTGLLKLGALRGWL